MGLKAPQRDKKTSKSDPYEGIEDMLDQNVEDIASHFDKTVSAVLRQFLQVGVLHVQIIHQNLSKANCLST